MKKTIQKLQGIKKTLDGMPDVFTCEQFCNTGHTRIECRLYFYAFVYSGGLEKIKRGVYRKTPLINMDVKDVRKAFEKRLLEGREKAKLQKQTPYIFEPKARINDDAEMIRHLKAKGYRIMKPINQWEEL